MESPNIRLKAPSALGGFTFLLLLSVINIFTGKRTMSAFSVFQQFDIDDGNHTASESNRIKDIEASARRLAPCLYSKNSSCRFDSLGRFLEDGETPIRHFVHQQAQSVPPHRRMPHSMANNETFYLGGTTSYPDDPTKKDAVNAILEDYNPTILPLYKNSPTGSYTSDLDDQILDYITGRYHPGISKEEADRVQYIRVVRSSNHHPRCFVQEPNYINGYEWINYVAISLLDGDLQPIHGADVLIDIERYYFLKRDTRKFQDFSIYAARTTSSNRKKNQLLLLSNGFAAIPMDIRRVPPGQTNHNETDWKTKIHVPRVPDDMVFGDGLQVRLTYHRRLNDAGALTRWHSFENRRKGFRSSIVVSYGKNMHFFEDDQGFDNVELWPFANHTVRKVNFFFPNFTSFGDYSLRPPEGQKRILDTPDAVSGPSFHTIWEELTLQKNPNRGTGCCADLTLADGSKVKVGIAHSVFKDKSSRAYLHRFYAFRNEAPFPIIGLSGDFCLGHMQMTDKDNELHWLSKRESSFKTRQTRIGKRKTFDCPELTFASGITNMIGFNDDYIIISYGVDDCYSRSIIVHQKKIEILLFPPLLKDNQSSSTS